MSRTARVLSLAATLSLGLGTALPATAVEVPARPQAVILPAAATTTWQTTANLNLRQSASASSKSLLVIPKHTKLKVNRTGNGWSQVTYAKKTGWVSTRYLGPAGQKAKTYRYLSSYQVLRQNASSSSKSLAGLQRKTKIERLGATGSWTKVKAGGKTGFVPTSQLATGQPAAVYRYSQSKQAIYKTASTKGIPAKTLASGTKVEWLRTSGSWSYVLASGSYGWIQSSKLGTKAPVVDKVIGSRWVLDKTTVRATAASTGKSMGSIPAGEKLSLYSTSGSWSKVQTSRGTGWVPTSALVTSAYTPLSSVSRWSTSNVNLRAGNSAATKSLGVVPKAEKVTALGTSNGFTRVKTSKGTGWVSTSYLGTSRPQATQPESTRPNDTTHRWTTANVNLRAGAGTSYVSKGVVPVGEKVSYLKSANGWANVTTSRGGGWISESYLGTREPASLQPDAQKVINAVSGRFDDTITNMHTIRSGSTGHSSGKAVDLMIKNYKSAAGVAKGDRLAQFLLANRTQLGIYYLIWQDKIWLPHTGWTEYSTSGKYGAQFTGNWTDTTRHMDHIHVEVYGSAATNRALDLGVLK